MNRYIYLGFDGGDNPICLDSLDHEKVVFIDHERFLDPDLSGQFINSSIAQLAECILIFQEMLEQYWHKRGIDAKLYQRNVPAELIKQTRVGMGKADNRTVSEDGYWSQLLKYI